MLLDLVTFTDILNNKGSLLVFSNLYLGRSVWQGPGLLEIGVSGRMIVGLYAKVHALFAVVACLSSLASLTLFDLHLRSHI